MNIRARRILMTALVATFVLQTWLVYSDTTGRRTPLSELALRGSDVWHRENCQSCHQIYGFGGFLGPDLTNVSDQLSAERLESILTVGAGQMPALRLPAEDRRAVAAFLAEIDATGVSQPKLGESVPARDVLAQLVDGAETNGGLGPDVGLGYAIVRTQDCISCHLPNLASLHQAPDLTTMSESSGRERVLAVLRDGIPGKAMPRLGLSIEEGNAVFAFLVWLAEHGDDVRQRFEGATGGRSLDLTRIPWFEFP